MEKFISARKAAKVLGVSHVTVSNWCRDGRIPGVAILDDVAWIIPADITLNDIQRPVMGRPKEANQGKGKGG